MCNFKLNFETDHLTGPDKVSVNIGFPIFNIGFYRFNVFPFLLQIFHLFMFVMFVYNSNNNNQSFKLLFIEVKSLNLSSEIEFT